MADIDIEEHLSQIEWGKQQRNGEVLLSPAWEIFVLGISILSVFNLLIVAIIRNPDIEQVFVIMDLILTIVFVFDLLRRIVVADSARRYLVDGYGWVDALAAFPVLRILRLLRMYRLMIVLRRLGGPSKGFRAFFSNRAAGGLLSVLLIALLVLEFGALAVVAVERGAEGATIETAADGLWYVLVTMSTVGYGVYYPVTDLGRIFGSLIIIVGVGVFGTLTGFLATAFLAPSEMAQAAKEAAAVDKAEPIDGSNDAGGAEGGSAAGA